MWGGARYTNLYILGGVGEEIPLREQLETRGRDRNALRGYLWCNGQGGPSTAVLLRFAKQNLRSG
jgi:hypothetical protein